MRCQLVEPTSNCLICEPLPHQPITFCKATYKHLKVDMPIESDHYWKIEGSGHTPIWTHLGQPDQCTSVVNVITEDWLTRGAIAKLRCDTAAVLLGVKGGIPQNFEESIFLRMGVTSSWQLSTQQETDCCIISSSFLAYLESMVQGAKEWNQLTNQSQGCQEQTHIMPSSAKTN